VKGAFPDLPLSARDLDRLRFGLRRSVPSEGLGSHLRRKQGQSLEFREHRSYQYGDDIRMVDWRASQRTGREGPQIIKTFEAEERLAVAIVLDLRPALRLPLDAPKLLFALWTAMALCELVGREKDDVILGTVFGPEDDKPQLWRKGRALREMRKVAERIWSMPAAPLEGVPQARTGALCRSLRPASVVVLLSDMLFDDPDDEVGALLRVAQLRRRELLLVDIDSIPAEIADATAAAQSRRLATVEGRPFGADPVVLDTPLFDGARAAIDALRATRRKEWWQGGMTWHAPVRWPDRTAPAKAGFDAEQAAEAFRRVFPTLPVLRNLLSRGALG
jgi:uncharacterized protein (DUF58 family)